MQGEENAAFGDSAYLSAAWSPGRLTRVSDQIERRRRDFKLQQLMIQKIDKFLKIYSLIIIIIIGITGIYAARGLHSDGSFWLVEMLNRGGFYIFDPHRAYVQVLVQAPVAIAIWLGVLDLNTLIRIHSFGFVGVPLIFWIGALVLQYGNRLFCFFLMAFAVTYLRSNFFAAGEFSVAYGMAAFCASVLLRREITFVQAVLVSLTAIALTHSYEATFFLGLFLVALSIIRLLKGATDKSNVRGLIMISIPIFLIAVYVGGRSIFFQRTYSGDNVANFSALTEIHLIYLIAVPLFLSLLCMACCRKVKSGLFIVVSTLVGFYLLYAFRWDSGNISYGYFSYAYRALCCFLLLGILSIATAFRFWPEFFKTEPIDPTASLYLAIGVTIFFNSMAALMLYHTYGYFRWLQRFEQEAIVLKTHTPIDKTKINTNHGWTHGYNWMWGNPSTSILLRGNAEAMILNNSNHKDPEPGFYENVKPDDPLVPMDRSAYDAYPIKPFEKRTLLFPIFK